MRKKKWIAPLILALALAGGSISGCVTTDSGEQGIEALEGMSEYQYGKWKLYIQLGVKIGANELLEDEIVTEEELDLAASALEMIMSQPVTVGATTLVGPALEEVGLNSDEIELLLLIVEQELLSRGAMDWMSSNGTVALSPRTVEILTLVADALRAASVITEEEMQQGMMLQEEFE